MEKSLPDPTDPTDLNNYEKLRKKLNDYFMPKRKKNHASYILFENETDSRRIDRDVCYQIKRKGTGMRIRRNM